LTVANASPTMVNHHWRAWSLGRLREPFNFWWHQSYLWKGWS